ncbi:uncharacterized protein LOC130662784 isoform X3 [Hydractinia symbiolongicarpus]|uniref:uncharacterized protein LOC130662784 isoform X3 n=1 Tax=Hydractinia symbiolongicarpus TaxID=13093 RepID=UPI00254C0525|nr:uncharacterized protein LOC130662784 isoform X3 [Hydractinia symbiolongicarpus]
MVCQSISRSRKTEIFCFTLRAIASTHGKTLFLRLKHKLAVAESGSKIWARVFGINTSGSQAVMQVVILRKPWILHTECPKRDGIKENKGERHTTQAQTWILCTHLVPQSPWRVIMKSYLHQPISLLLHS